MSVIWVNCLCGRRPMRANMKPYVICHMNPIVAVLTERVSDAHLAGLRQDGVSYIFAGERELDLGLALEILNRELGLERVLLEGGGGSNGSFLRAGPIDEISIAICPAIDGAK